MHGSLPPHHFVLGSVSTFRCDNLFRLKTFRHGSLPPQITNIQVSKKILQNRLKHPCVAVNQLLS